MKKNIWHQLPKKWWLNWILLGTLQMKLQSSIFEIKDVLDLDKFDADVNNLLQYLLLSQEMVGEMKKLHCKEPGKCFFWKGNAAPTRGCCPMIICLNMPATAS
jgi:hypothetical protein